MNNNESTQGQSPQAATRNSLSAWQQLCNSAQTIQQHHLSEYAYCQERAQNLLFSDNGLYVDFSKQKVTNEVLSQLIELANACQLKEAIQGLLRGDIVNNTEHRAALHTLLRVPVGATHSCTEQLANVHQSLDKMRKIVEQIHNGQWRGVTGWPITDVVNIGVGGSDLGPAMANRTLEEYACSPNLKVHFASSIDGAQLSVILPTLNPKSTVFIISSKSFTTLDTMANAETALKWLAASEKYTVEQIKRHHFIGVSTKPELMDQWGIDKSHQLEFWDWVGGRFSMWSAIGLPTALLIGMDGFLAMLAGAHSMDQHFANAAFDRNIPVLLGLINVWNATFLKINAQAVLPYDGRMELFPNYLTQLEMESNGKSVTKSGVKVDYPTCPIIWGEVGPNAQHAFFQLLHQGTQQVSCVFLASIAPKTMRNSSEYATDSLRKQHVLSLSNFLGQSRVMMLGDAIQSEALAQVPAYKRYRGDQPSTTILFDKIDPFTLGRLVALYEHNVFVMSVIWDINPFDQWGVELGKKIANQLVEVFNDPSDSNTHSLDASTQALLKLITAAKH